MRGFRGDRSGSAVQWFTLAAAGLCAASLAGAHGLDWLSQPGRVSLVAYRAPAAEPAGAGEGARRRAAADPGVDMAPTGSLPAGSALVIRIR